MRWNDNNEKETLNAKNLQFNDTLMIPAFPRFTRTKKIKKACTV